MTPAETAALARDIVATHHAFLQRELPRLGGLLGDASPRLRAPFAHLRRTMDEHMAKEEGILFPMILALAEGRDVGGCGVVGPIAQMGAEHDEIRTLEDALRSASRDAGALEPALLAMLDDLAVHAAKEDELLFPAALALAREREAAAAAPEVDAPPAAGVRKVAPGREKGPEVGATAVDRVVRQTQGTCSVCLKRVPAAVLVREGAVVLEKRCAEHGASVQLLSRRPDRWAELDRFYFSVMDEAHPQRDFIVRMTERCNLACPICLAKANTEDTPDLDLSGLETLLSERRGIKIDLMAAEPTLREDLEDWVRKVKASGNIAALHTNGLKLANRAYAARLKEAGVDEVFLQFDGLDDEANRALRGRPLLKARTAALKNLHDLGIATSLIVVIARGLNEAQVGETFRFALEAGNEHIREVFFLGLRSLGSARETGAILRWTALVLASPAALWSAEPLVRGAWGALRHRALSVDLPVAVGIVAMYVHGVVATIGGREAWLDSLTMLIALLLAGRVLEQGGRRRAVEAAQALAGYAPATARRRRGETVECVSTNALVPGDRVLVGLGEAVTADGRVVAGAARVQMALLTGESEPTSLAAGDRVVAGAIVADGSLEIEVTATGADTLVARMAAEVARAADRPARPVLADRLAPAFTVATLAFAGLANWLNGGEAGLAVLVVAYPCALALAAPLTTAVALGAAARRGLLVRSGDALRRLAEVDLVVFDKTGTLTGGEPAVVSAEAPVLRVAAALARHSAHPVSRALVAASAARGLPLAEASNVHELPGEGLEGIVDGRPVRFVRGCVEGMGEITLRDTLRPDAARVVAALRERVVLLSGDREAVARGIAAEAGITEVVAPASPAEKAAWIEARRREGRVVLFVGDGVNDGAALAAADVGVAMGEGAGASVLVADAVVVGEGLAPVAAGLRVARAMASAIRWGVARAHAYNVVAVAVAVAGWMNPLIAAIAMPLSSAVAVWGARRVAST
jgi:Cu2+-exporting ATPase